MAPTPDQRMGRLVAWGFMGCACLLVLAAVACEVFQRSEHMVLPFCFVGGCLSILGMLFMEDTYNA